jgi:hypothetical protein
MGEFERAARDGEEVARLESSGKRLQQNIGLNGYQTRRNLGFAR